MLKKAAAVDGALYLHHEAEEGGEAVPGGVEELPTGLII